MDWVFRPPPFLPQHQQLFQVALFSGEAGDISGTAVITFSEVAALGSYNNLAGSEVIAFSEAAALGSLNALAGSEVIVFSEVAALDAHQFGDLTASELIEFSELAGLDAHIFIDGAGATIIIFTETASIEDAATAPGEQPILPIIPPHIRTIDAKSLADHFNRGQPELPDYEWPNARKFYQDDSPA